MPNSSAPLKILWMIPKWTLPVTDGARVATDSLIRNTIAAGAEVDVLCLPVLSEKTDPASMIAAWKIKNVHVVPRNMPDSSWAKKRFFATRLLSDPLVPLTFSSFVTKDIQTKVNQQIATNKYDFILLDGLHLGATFIKGNKFIKKSHFPKIIYRAHNIEVDLWKKAYQEKKSPVLKLILYLQSVLVERFEKLIINSSEGIAAISQEDLVEINKISHQKSELVPLGLNFENPLKAYEGKSARFLFIGRLDWPPNKDGLEWLLKEVWPTVIENRPDAILKIVGSGNKDWLKNYQNLKGVEIVGFVDSIQDAYQDCHFTIVPISYGSGTRIKVLESFAMGRRLISTKMGVQGADLDQQDYIQAESKEDWIRTLSQIELNQAEIIQLENSRTKVSSKFGEKNIGERFYRWLKTF